ncbi:hypothetical protein [Vulcanisaeta distributa]|uniref:hypothetical protein n=1 Tax=Vulcanisaeta distributa TaxID=164451 RepID=UPI0006D27F18|nr:hypothetical protein [Vulcanisaeta distributa]
MHWEALAFFIEPRELILGDYAIIGYATAEIGDCNVSIKSLEYVRAGVDALVKAVNQGIKLHTAYPSMYMDVVNYFLRRLGVPRYAYKVVNADPMATPFRAVTDADVVRNIAYLHGVLWIVARNWLRMGKPKTSHAIHGILLKSGYNADKALADRYRGPVPCKIKLA